MVAFIFLENRATLKNYSGDKMSRNSAHRALQVLPSSSPAVEGWPWGSTLPSLRYKGPPSLGTAVLQPGARGPLSSCDSGSSTALSSIGKAEIPAALAGKWQLLVACPVSKEGCGQVCN